MDFVSLADRIARGTINAGHSSAEWKWILTELKMTEDQYLYLYNLPDHLLIQYSMGGSLPGNPPHWTYPMRDQMLDIMIRYEVEVLGMIKEDPQ